MTRTVIVGGVAGGASAAARLRRRDESAEIILLERGEHVSFANCGLPYYAGGSITERDRLFLMTPAKFRESLNVEVRVRHEVRAIHPAEKTLEVADIAKGEVYTLSYDHLLLSPGSSPIRPPLAGIEDSRILTVRNVPDIDRVKALLDRGTAKRAVVVGGGFIGLEMAENLRERGLLVDVVEALDQVLAPLDFEMAAMVHQHLRDKGVSLHLADSLAGFESTPDGIRAKLSSGRNLDADLVILSIGVRPDTGFVRESGIALDERGHILVDTHLRTSLPDIWAVGDATSSHSFLLGKNWPVPLAGPANKQARIAADNIAGDDKIWKGSIATAIAKVFDLAAGSTGLSEKFCRREGIPCKSVAVHPQSHASYYPGATPYSLKLVWNPETGKILGAQAVGSDGVDKRLDVVASLIGMGGTIDDLAEFEHTYAPPYSGAKDGTNYAAFAAQNIRDGLSDSVTWREFEERRAAGALVLDVRTPQEHELGNIEESLNIPHTELRGRIKEIPSDRDILIHCAVGIRGYLAERVLRSHGFARVSNLSGGFRTWSVATESQRDPGAFRTGLVQAASQTTTREGSEDGTPAEPAFDGPAVVVDACGLQCPGPIIRMKEACDLAQPGQSLAVRSTDPGFRRDVGSWCKMTGNVLEGVTESGGVWTANVRKAASGKPASPSAIDASSKDLSIVVFSNELDRALASFVIANGAVASGKKATLFFTFWGLSVIRQKPAHKPAKDLVSRAFDMLLPAGARKLALSRMNFGGLGSRLMRWRMADKEVSHLEDMIEVARRSGVRMVACQMSMDLMGIQPMELLEGVEIGGVAAYLDAAGDSRVNLFI
jgi:NADPH-dependent 2,4-dienoyl-CoA reductase/sulfur reductase-like enzyme/peroxiredoxin family protein/rhodanese-related sulfurtransferase/TusA-related sulfurtransferase